MKTDKSILKKIPLKWRRKIKKTATLDPAMLVRAHFLIIALMPFVK